MSAVASAETTPRSRAPRAKKLWASVLVVLLALTGVTALTGQSHAAGPGTGWGTWGDNTYGWQGSFNAGDGVHIYCIEPSRPLPEGWTQDAGYWGNAGGISGNRLAGINAVISKYGQTNDRNQAAAVKFAVQAAADWNYTIYDYGYDGRYGHNIDGAVMWQISRYGNANMRAVQGMANAYYNEINNTVASPAGGGTGRFTFQVDGSNNYLGTLTVATDPTSATGTVTLTNGIFTDTGSATRAGVRNGQVLPITGVPPAGSPGAYKIAATGNFTAPGSGYSATVRAYTTPNQQVAVGPGQPSTQSFTFTGEDPILRSGQFLPNLRTSAPAFVQEGEAFSDQVTFFTVADDEGTNNPWATRPDGTYRNVTATGTLYGPFASAPVVSATVPAGAPVAGTATVTTTDAQGPTAPYSASAGTARQSGYYTWVWTISQQAQSAVNRNYIPEGYVFTDRFGLSAETSVVPMKPVSTSAVNLAWANPGEQVRDTLTVSNSNGAWLTGTTARFEGTAYGIRNGSVPPVQDAAPAGAVVLGTQSLTFTQPGSQTSTPVTVPDNVGSVVWVWRFVGANQAQPQHFAPNYTSVEQFGLTSSTTRVRMSPTLSTQVASAIPTGAFNDQVTLSVGNGHWIAGSAITAQGTLYGPLLTRPAEAGQVPVGTPVAHETSLTFNGPGTLTTNTGYTPEYSGYYTWVWKLSYAEQSAATQQAMPANYSFTDRFGLAAETSFNPMRPVATSQVVQDIVGTGQRTSDTLTVSNTGGTWLTGAQATFTGTAYAVTSGEKPTPSDTVPANARAIGTQTLTFTGPGSKTSERVVVPNDAGYVVWVWEFVTADQPAAQQANYPAGYRWADQFGLANETTEVQFMPVITTQVTERVPGGAFNDVVTMSTSRGQWLEGTEVTVDGTLYGPFSSMPNRATGVPLDAPVAHETSLTFTGAGSQTTDTDFRPEDSGFYTWVWSVDADEQPAETRDVIPSGYKYSHDFGIVEETSILPMHPSAHTRVVQERADAGTVVTDTLTVENTNGDWFDGAVATYDGVAYSVPADTAPEPGDDIPADAVAILETSIEVTGPGTYTSEGAVVPDDAGFIVWVWTFRQADQADPEKWLPGMNWRDQFGLAEETTTVTFEPVLTTQVPERVPTGSFDDVVTMSAARGQWHAGTPVVAEGVLYGPFLDEPAVSRDVPAGAPVAHETTLTFTGPGSQTTDTGFRPTEAGFYTWVWTVDAAAQQPLTQLLLPEDYTYADRFGLRAETSVLPMSPSAVTKVSETHADAGDVVTDTLTVENTNGGWFTGAVGVYEGVAYSVPATTAPAVGSDVPADAERILETSIVVSGPGTYTSEGATVPDDSGRVVWVWTFRQSEQADLEKWEPDLVWEDQFGLADETTIVTFQPALSTQVTERIPGGAFDDAVTVEVVKGQWHDNTEVTAHGTLYGPLVTQPEVTAAAPEDAPVAHETSLTFTEPGTLVTDTQFRPSVNGYYVWQWEIDADRQSGDTKLLLPDGYTQGDAFGLEAETSILPMTLTTVTEVAHAEVLLGQPVVDTMTVEVANGQWLQSEGENITVTYRGDAYFVAGDLAPEQTTDIPEDAELMDSVLFDIDTAGDFVMPAVAGEEHRNGFVTWVWQINEADQPMERRGMTDEWADDFGVPAETSDILMPEVETLSQAGTKLGGTVQDTAYVTGFLPLRGAELTFEAYAVPMVQDANGKWVVDFPAEEPVEPSEPGEATPEDEVVMQSEDEEDDTASPDEQAPETDWSWVVSEENLIGSNLDAGEIITEPGVYTSPAFVASEYRKVLWVESLWTAAPEVEEPAEGTEPVEGEEPGDVEILAEGDEETPAEDEAFERQLIHRGVVGIPNETSFVLDVKTYAMSDSGARANVEHGIATWDTAELTGYVPENGTLEFEAYLVPTSDTGDLATACTDDRLTWTSPAIDLDGGLYPAGDPLKVTGAEHTFNPDVDSALYWVAVTKDELDREVSRGDCGDPDETIGLKGQKVLNTSGPLTLGVAIGGLALLSVLLFIAVHRRRKA